MGLYQKHRPTNFDDFIGNEVLVSVLTGLLKKKKKFPHALFLTGSTGCGKTTLGRIIAKELGAHDSEIIEIDSGQFSGVDTIRKLRENIQYNPINSDVKVFLVDEIHELSSTAQNAFLKTLEDTPPFVYFILCTTEQQKVIAPIRNRCSTHEVSLVKDSDMIQLLKRIAKEEKKGVSTEICQNIAKSAKGVPRQAINILEQVISVPKKLRLKVSKTANIEEAVSMELCRALFSKRRTWNEVASILKGLRDQDAEKIRRAVLGYATSVLLNNRGVNAFTHYTAFVIEVFSDNVYDSGFPGLAGYCYTVINNPD